MLGLESILEYQKKDGQLVAIEREIADSKAKKLVNQMVSIVKTAQQKIVTVEKNSKVLIDNYNQLLGTYEKQNKFIETLSKKKLENATVEELTEYESQIKESTTSLLLLEKNIAQLSKSISEALKEFEKTKNEVVQAKQKHAQGMSVYKSLVDSKQQTIDDLKSELAKLEKKVDAKLLAKYKKMRDDKKFPVFVPLLNNTCGGCSMGLPMSQLNKLDENGMLECENCHRIIYK